MRGQLQSIKFSVNTAILHAPLAHWHTLKEVLKISSRKFHSKNFYFIHDTAIYLKVIVLTYDLRILRAREGHKYGRRLATDVT